MFQRYTKGVKIYTFCDVLEPDSKICIINKDDFFNEVEIAYKPKFSKI